MTSQDCPSGNRPLTLQSPSGLNINLNANGSIRRMDYGDILINLYLGTEIEGGPANLYLRRHSPTMEAMPLLGPHSPAVFQGAGRQATATGKGGGVAFHLSLVLAESAPAWFWHVVLENTGSAAQIIDLIYAQDLALAHYGTVRVNEYYTSHYVDHTALSHPERGFVMASRQNLSMGGRNPWTVIGALDRGASYATDALQIHGLETRAGKQALGLTRGLPGGRLQHEHSMAAIQDSLVRLEPGATIERGFFGWFEPDHPAATSENDLALVDRAMALPEALPPQERGPCADTRPAASLFSTARLLDALNLTEAEITDLFGKGIREEERTDGQLLSFFVGRHGHVVLKAKELKVLRPHTHILRTGQDLVPDEASLTSTTWMAGVFHSMVTQGHVNINRFLSTCHSYLGLLRGNGQRLFVQLAGNWCLLDVPSAFEMALRGCRWIYKHAHGLIAVRSEALTDRHELTLTMEVLSGPPVRLLLSNHVAINGDDGSEAIPVTYIRDGEGVFVRPVPDSDVGRRFPAGGFHLGPLAGTVIEQVGGDELLFTDGVSRSQPYITMITAPGLSAGFRIRGRLIPESPHIPKINGHGDLADEGRLLESRTDRLGFHPPATGPLAGHVARLGDILPWFIHNSLVHYLAPRGIEQYTGGGWGTRDICQGPVELLLAMGHSEPIRDLLIRVFKAQNPDGDWPQWFMFFDRERNIRPNDSHGDIVFWPILALARYLNASEDRGLLDEWVPFFHPEGEEQAEQAPMWQHLERAFTVIDAKMISGTRLVAFGNGDWNDSLQPVQPAMRERLCSSWTVTLHYQTLTTLIRALHLLGLGDRAADLETLASEIRNDFRRVLMKDDVLTGYAYFLENGRMDYLLHPRDRATGVSYSLLPMIHAIISDLLTPEEAGKHLKLIRIHLMGPDGARLFDLPIQYRGGPQNYFQRAESAAFFGREIGLMYTHAHLRYAEALAHFGDVQNFFLALCQANPIGIRTLVKGATLRQANCYYSSSDAAFSDRYQALAEYNRLKKGEVELDGGWRVYSSGPGIATRLILECFLGICLQRSSLVIDPAVPRSLDGLRVEMELAGHMMEVVYRIKAAGCGPTALNLNGKDLAFRRVPNPYRTGGVEIPMSELRELLHDGLNRMTVFLD